MELHSCHNCQVIEEVISSKLQKFHVLAEENLTLHRVLLKLKASEMALRAEVVSLNNIIATERERNLDLYFKQINEQKSSNMLMNVKLKANAKSLSEHISYTKTVSFQPSAVKSDPPLLLDKYESLMSLYEEQTKIYEENLNTLRNVNEKYVKKLELELQNILDHSSTILNMYSFYQTELFTQKLDNSRDRKEFLETVNVISNINKKHLAKVKQQLLEETTLTVNEQSKGVLNSLLQQINKRDKLVYMLRQHQAHFNREIARLENQFMMEHQNAGKIINNLQEKLKSQKQKYLALEQRRKFDVQGFQTDIQHFRKKLEKLRYHANVAELNREIIGIEEGLRKNVSGHCVDIHSQIISQGLHYVPGPNSCTLCICDKGGPKWCKSVLCSQPQKCKSFQRGNSCCEFKCLDDILTANDTYSTYDFAFRVIASAIFIVLTLLLLFFVIHRFRRYKLRVQQNRQLGDDQRSLNSIGYITGSLGYLPGSIGYLGSGTNDLEFHYEESNGHFSLWKPPGNYFPRGEAPPPYEEAIRSNHMDTTLGQNQALVTTANDSSIQSHQVRTARCTPTRVQCRHQRLTNRANNVQEYANLTIETGTNQQTEPLIKVNTHNNAAHSYLKNHSNVTALSDKNASTRDSIDKSRSVENITSRNGDKVATTSHSERKRTHRNLALFADLENIKIDKNKLMFLKYENIILRNSPITNDSRSSDVDKSRTETSSNSKINNNGEAFYVNINTGYDTARHRTIPNINEYRKQFPSVKESKSKDDVFLLAESSKEFKDISSHRTLPKNLKELTVSVSANNENTGDIAKKPDTDDCIHKTLSKQASSLDAILSLNLIKSHINLCEKLNKDALEAASFSSTSFLENRIEERSKSVIEDRNSFSYRCLSPSQDEDDYRSECENCKSSEITNLEDEEGDVFNETMTLQRRPETSEEVPYYRTSLTLPTQIRKPRAVTPNPGRNGWFMTMQETSSSEESE
ncbi:hypothetical protein FQR65_LT11383 [Abscondita terminalis]|nr:hypothetical protein FQR65_LT11383 [Abscondita terminalis]